MSQPPLVCTSDKYLMRLERNILYLRFADKKVIGVKDAIEIDTKAFDMVKGEPFLLLVDSTNSLVSVTAAAREYFATDEMIVKIRVAQAFVVDNTPNRILARFYAYFNPQKSPVEIFEHHLEAERWLLSHWRNRFPKGC